MDQKLTAARLREVLRYDQETGEFHWLVTNSMRALAGSKAGALVDGYVAIGIDGRSYQAHRLAWLYMHGEWPPSLLDHRDTDKANNRIENLRPATQRLNAQNQVRPGKANTSGYLGVSWHKAARKWHAGIKTEGRRVHLGLFSSPEEASAAYVAAKRRLHEFCTI